MVHGRRVEDECAVYKMHSLCVRSSFHFLFPLISNTRSRLVSLLALLCHVDIWFGLVWFGLGHKEQIIPLSHVPSCPRTAYNQPANQDVSRTIEDCTFRDYQAFPFVRVNLGVTEITSGSLVDIPTVVSALDKLCSRSFDSG
jgi:hypothetical protein